MNHTNLRLTSLFVWFVAAGCSIWAVGCGESSKTVAQKPLGVPAPGEFDQLELKVNDKDALDGKVVLPTDKRFKVSGQFHFVKPYQGDPPIGSIIVSLKGAEKEKKLGGRAGADNLKFIGNRKATFSCNDIRGPTETGQYTISVIGNNNKTIMQAKVLVE